VRDEGSSGAAPRSSARSASAAASVSAGDPPPRKRPLQVLRHAMETSATYATRAAALAAGRFLARQLAAARALTGILEDPCDDGLLIYGTIQDETGKIIDVPLLVRVSFPGADPAFAARLDASPTTMAGTPRRPLPRLHAYPGLTIYEWLQHA